MNTKPCPYCAEQIMQDATICRYCNTDLRTGESRYKPTQNNAPPKQNLSVGDGVRTGCGMFIVLPIIILVIILLMFMGLIAC